MWLAIAVVIFGLGLVVLGLMRGWVWSYFFGWIALVLGAFGAGIEYEHGKALAWADNMQSRGCAVVEMRGSIPSAFKCPDGVIYR